MKHIIGPAPRPVTFRDLAAVRAAVAPAQTLSIFRRSWCSLTTARQDELLVLAGIR